MKLKELKEQRADVVRSLNQLSESVAAESRNFTEDEKEQFDKLDAEQRSLKDAIETQERVERSKQLVTPEHKESISYRPLQVRPEDQDLAFRAWVLRSAGHDHLINDRMRQAVDRTGFNLASSYVSRAQTVGTAGEGGNLTDGSIFQGVEKALKAFGGMRSVSRVIKTANGNPIHFATLDDTANVGAIVGENTTVTQVALTFGKKSLGAYKYSSGVWPVSIELIQDSGVDIGAMVGEALGTRLARIHNTHFTTGNASSKPSGVMQTATSALTAAATGAVTFDELISLYHAVDASYRNDPSCVWMMNDSTFAELKKMVDGNDRPLFLNDYVNGAPNSLLGKPVVINNDMAAMSAATKPIAFGAFSNYVIRDVLDTQVKVLNELYALDGSVAFVCFSRQDGILLNASAIKCITMHA